MDLGIEGRVALVMGASQGIGHGIAAVLAREGARVAIASRSAEKLERAAAEVGAAATFVADTADLDGLAALPGEVAEVLGEPAGILITNTGGPPAGPAVATWRRSPRTVSSSWETPSTWGMGGVTRR